MEDVQKNIIQPMIDQLTWSENIAKVHSVIKNTSERKRGILWYNFGYYKQMSIDRWFKEFKSSEEYYESKVAKIPLSLRLFKLKVVCGGLDARQRYLENYFAHFLGGMTLDVANYLILPDDKDKKVMLHLDGQSRPIIECYNDSYNYQGKAIHISNPVD